MTFDNLPLIAIIRGITPAEVISVANALIDTGFTRIEVPLNSPDAITSIRMLVQQFGSDYLVGAGTVTTVEEAQAVTATGAKLVVTPNCNEKVIQLCKAAGCVTYPGIATPTEAFSALAAGATGLKLFPISTIGLDGMKALRSVLPPCTELYPVGGIEASVESMKPYLDAGANGFGLGSALYKPGMTISEVSKNAKKFVNTYKIIHSIEAKDM